MTDTQEQPIRPDAARYGECGRVVVGVDDSAGGLAALRWAVGLARSRGAELVAVRAWALGLPRHGGRRHRGDDHHHVVLAFTGNAPREAAKELIRRAFRVAAGGVPRDLAVSIETPEGDPGAVLTGLATHADDLLVVGTQHGHGLKRLVHGSVSRYCSIRSRCPVVVISPDGSPGPGDLPSFDQSSPDDQSRDDQPRDDQPSSERQWPAGAVR
jgi:nucleotide-binding universal stress UspA family protein